ncbi:hypothetical protein ACFV9C_42755 [Kribbella sp. NPDC059898]|uniref:hypothetical protein n=1 Tax=Kribbella sp. NPDC059898 TaxID=3346995 RepID=UPI0036586EA1
MSGLTAAEVLALLAEYGECRCSPVDRQLGRFRDGCPKHQASRASSDAERAGPIGLILPAAVNPRFLSSYLKSEGDKNRVVVAVVLWRVVSSVLRRDDPLQPVDGQTFTEAAEAYVRGAARALKIRAEPGSVLHRQGAALYLTQEIELLGLSAQFLRLLAAEGTSR